MQKSTRSSSSAEEVAGSIDTLTEILLRLPPQPLLRFKSVSKLWRSLISDPRFRQSHSLRHHTSPSALLLSDYSALEPYFHIVPLTTTCDTTVPSTVRSLNLNFLNDPRVSVVRSCNGLLLCHSGTSYLVCNPTTRKFVTLSFPNHQFMHQTRAPHALYLAFDPLKSPHYQVISLGILARELHGDCLCDIHVYSSRTGLWGDCGPCFTAQYRVIASAGVYCNRAIHWCVDGEISLYFHIDNQCLKTLPAPLRAEEWRRYRSVEYFGESGGRLHLILSERTLKFDVLELEEDYSMWSLRHRVDLNPIRVEFPEVHWDLANFVLPFFVVCQAREENSMMVLLVGGTAISYNPVNCTSRKLRDFKPEMTMLEAVAGYMSGEVFQYFENPSSVEGYNA